MKIYRSREQAIIDLMAKYGKALSYKTNKQLEREYQKIVMAFEGDKAVISDTNELSTKAFERGL